MARASNVTSPRQDGDWFEDAESDPEWEDQDDESLECNRDPSLEMREKNKFLEMAWKTAETGCKQLQAENDKLKAQLEHEKHRAAKFQKKLQYIQDNQQIFARLKEAYINMKYNESTGKGMVEIRETASQTWKGILCSECIKTAEFREQMGLQNLCNSAGNLGPAPIPVKQTQIDNIKETIVQLKKVIEMREASYSMNQEREQAFRDKIKSLEHENGLLQEVINSKQFQESIPEKGQNDMAIRGCMLLKKIIFKQEKRLREMAKYNRYGKFPASPLNDNERELVELIVSKYLKRLGKKSVTSIRSISCDRCFDTRPGSVKNPRRSENTAAAAGHGDNVCENEVSDFEIYRYLSSQTEIKKDADLGDFVDYS